MPRGGGRTLLPGLYVRDVTAAIKDGDDPATVAKAIVKAATDRKPKLRYTPGSRARQISTLRRIAPARAFDSQIRKFNRLAT
jgi:hypothetical protein